MNQGPSGDRGIDIDRIATLARIHFSEEERADLRRNLDSILGHFEKLSEIDITGVEPSAHAFPLYDVLREDVAGPVFDLETALQNAPKQRNGLVVVPKVVE
ncbi:MAG: Asp-tRNA(Asn)/Glu-tRNA(Gln) amidotransferase subunit GatC [Puniceicoccales bacterium]|jgi:aspartyl-tRNA(Asn)/glutamyl-tRNA(Gln) amidotransferase subunit C|nr:Asp-tRNA(Asn)/Glu-tRNA(Gln) amidotransferase subunit GatC [Puniceicoccales bacterium]